MAVSSVIFICCFLLALASASQLRNDPENPFVAYGNGTVFDISKVFTYPVSFKEARGYTYWWDPRNVSCGSQRMVAPVCQKADQYYECGTASPVWLLQQYNPFKFVIQYPGGQWWRITMITFLEDATIDPPQISFVSEDPYLQYNFLVKGKCVGQPFGCGSDSEREIPEGPLRFLRLHQANSSKAAP
eukprot:m.231277 g.231277  ORF g.231277 m.231277 type:complete len:187 (-) comp18310_c0_seq1:241-801(-)